MDAGYSRVQFLRRGAFAAAGVAGLRLLDPLAAFARPGNGVPSPIPGGLKFLAGPPFIQPVPANPDIHVLPPTAGFDLGTITDFNGVVGASELQGTASGSD